MQKENKKSSGWRAIESWQYVVTTLIISALAIAATWVTSRKFDPILILLVFLPVLTGIILSWCTILYSRFNKELTASVHDLKLARKILRDIALSKAIDESKWLIHCDEVQNNEASENVSENWTLTPDFHYEVADFQRVVIENFKKNLNPQDPKTKYEYIYPNTEASKQRLDEFRKIVVTSLVKTLPVNSNPHVLKELNNYVKIYPIKENIVPLTEGIHNPRNGSSKVGLLMTPEEDFPYYIRLNLTQTDALSIKFRQLKVLSKDEQDGKQTYFLTDKIIDENL